MIKVDNLSFSYGNKKNILKNISFSIKDHGFTAIIGPNGSGKTTLLHNLCRFYKPSYGSIYLFDKDINLYNYSELSKLFAFIPQETIINFPYKVIDVVLTGRIPYKNRFESYGKSDIKIAYDLMDELEITNYAESYINHLSGGEKQRVFFAKALAQKTKLYFLDEAFSAMDISHQLKCLNILREKIKNEDIKVIAIMHDLYIIDHFSDFVIALDKGKLKSSDTSKNIMTTNFLKELFNVKVERVDKKGLIIIP